MWDQVISAVGELPTIQVDVNTVRSWVQFVAEVTAVVVIINTIRKRADQRQAERFEQIIAAATQPIQPGYRNGGDSLADVAADVKVLREVQAEQRHHLNEQRVIILDVRERVSDLSDRVDENRDTAATGLAELTRVVESNAAAAAELGLALQQQSPVIPDEPDLD
jgi:hypothetical protein